MRRLTHIGVTVLVLSLAMLFVACGEGSGSSSSSSSGSSSTIKLGFSAWPGWFPWQVTQEAGIFKQVGLNVDLVWFEGYTDSINALAGGQLDANSQTLSDTLASVAAGSNQVIVLVNDNSTGNDQVIVAEGINATRELAGKRIGVEAGVVDHFLLLQGLKSAGMTEKDIQLVNLETGAAAAAFASGQLDGVAVFAPFTTQALARRGSKTLFSSADYPGTIPDHLAVSGDFVKNRPGDVQKLVDAWFLTLDYIKNNPDKATEIMAKRAGVSVSEYKSYEKGTTLFSVADNLAAFKTGTDFKSLYFAGDEISKFLVDSGLVQKAPDRTSLFNASFVQNYADRSR